MRGIKTLSGITLVFFCCFWNATSLSHQWTEKTAYLLFTIDSNDLIAIPSFINETIHSTDTNLFALLFNRISSSVDKSFKYSANSFCDTESIKPLSYKLSGHTTLNILKRLKSDVLS